MQVLTGDLVDLNSERSEEAAAVDLDKRDPFLPRQFRDPLHLAWLFDVDRQHERVWSQVSQAGQRFDAGVPLDVRVEFGEEIDDLGGARVSETRRRQEKVGANVALVGHLVVENGELTDAWKREFAVSFPV